MLTFDINLTFANQSECDNWEEKNLPDRTYKGHTVFSVNHECDIRSDKVTITSIMCF